MSLTPSRPSTRSLTAVSAALGVLLGEGPAARLERALAALAADRGSAALYRLDGDRFRAVAGTPSAPELPPTGAAARKLRGGRTSGDLVPLRAGGRTVGALELRGVAPLPPRELKVVTRAFALAVRRRDPVGHGARGTRRLLKAASAATVGELTASVVHELNNPLFGMLGLVEFLLEETEPGSKAHERLLLVQSSGLELKAKIRLLLDVATDRVPRGEVRLDAVAASTVELMRSVGVGRTIEFVERYAGRSTLVARPADLKLAVLALLLTAVDAAGGGGRVELDVETSRDRVSLTVAPGLDEEAAALAFEPFSAAGIGAGLGLAAARAVARSLGGDVVAQGSTLRLTARRGGPR